MRRLIINPVATLVLGAALIADALTLPRHWIDGGTSVVGRFVGSMCGGPAIQSQSPLYDSLVVKEGGRIRVLQPNIESWDEATRLLAEHPSSTAIMDYTPRVDRTGFWAITREDSTHEIRTDGGSTFKEADWRAARGAMLDAVFGEGAARSEVLVRLRTENFSRSRILWGGVAHNVAALGAFTLLCWSLRWVPDALAAHRRRLADAALRMRVCPHCGYSLQGLLGRVCPECGATLDLNERDPGGRPGS